MGVVKSAEKPQFTSEYVYFSLYFLALFWRPALLKKVPMFRPLERPFQQYQVFSSVVILTTVIVNLSIAYRICSAHCIISVNIRETGLFRMLFEHNLFSSWADDEVGPLASSHPGYVTMVTVVLSLAISRLV